MTDQIKNLLRCDREPISASLREPTFRSLAQYRLIILIGSGAYGFTVGLWRAPLQSIFTAIKFPLLIFLTCIGNGAVNGMLAQLLGSGLSFRNAFRHLFL